MKLGSRSTVSFERRDGGASQGETRRLCRAAALTLLLAACGSRSAATVSVGASTARLPAVDDRECRDAISRLEQIEQQASGAEPARAHCSAADARAAVSLCESLGPRAESLAERMEAKAQTSTDAQSVTLSANGRWALQGSSGIAHVFELTVDGPKPAYALEGTATWVFVRDRLFALGQGSLRVLDPATGSLQSFPDVESFDADDATIALVGRRYGWSTPAPFRWSTRSRSASRLTSGSPNSSPKHERSYPVKPLRLSVDTRWSSGRRNPPPPRATRRALSCAISTTPARSLQVSSGVRTSFSPISAWCATTRKSVAVMIPITSPFSFTTGRALILKSINMPTAS